MTAPDDPVRLSPLSARTVLAVGGPDAESFLDGLLTNTVADVAAAPVYAGLLTPQGKLLFDMCLAGLGEFVLLDVAAAQAAALSQRLALYRLRAKVVIEPRADWTVWALWGTDALRRLSLRPGQTRAFGNGVAFADPRSSALGARLLLPAGEAPPQMETVSADVFQALRFDLGIGEGEEIGDERCYPLEANFESLHGVDFKKGCYVGQELTARMKHRGGLRKRVLPVRADAPLPVDASIDAGGKTIGTILTAQGARGLALVRLDRLAETRGVPLHAGGIAVTCGWPPYLPPLESAAS